jgi:hypothetical protein
MNDKSTLDDKSTLEQNHKPRLTDPHASPAAFSAMLALQKASMNADWSRL